MVQSYEEKASEIEIDEGEEEVEEKKEEEKEEEKEIGMRGKNWKSNRKLDPS